MKVSGCSGYNCIRSHLDVISYLQPNKKLLTSVT